MIENKLIKILKDNSFDKGWGLFAPYRGAIVKNIRCKGISISDVVKKITYATSILLILQDNCLPRKIVEELIWVNKYIQLSIIAKSQLILEKYSDLKFSRATVDESVSADYIGIDCKDGKSFYLFADGITETDDTIEKVLLGHKPEKKYEWLNGAREVFVVDGKGQLEHRDLLDLCIKKNIKVSYVCSTESYNKCIYDALSKTSMQILVAKKLKNGVICIRDNRLYFVNEFWGAEILTEIADINYCIQSPLFECMKLKEYLSGEEIPQSAYFIDKKEMTLLSIDSSIIVPLEVKGLSMKDFLDEKFDSSITENHNNYCFKAKRVEYRFALVPPIFDHSYKLSSIYEPANDIYGMWEKNFTISPEALWSDVKEFGSFQSWSDFINLLKQVNKSLSKTVMEYQYSGYHSLVDNYIKFLSAENATLIDKFLQIHNSIVGESSTVQYSKFDEEIEGYRRTIDEKRVLVRQGKDVISNNRRIEILEKKIEDLSALKKRFETKSSDRKSEEQNEFIKKCKDILSGKVNRSEVDSVSNVINKGELTRTAKFNLFLDKWLKRTGSFLESGISILKEFATIDVPEDYVVYDKDGKRYIVIEDESEYQKTLGLCDKYKIECLARR